MMYRRDPYRRTMRRTRRTFRNRDGAYSLLILDAGEPAGLIVAAMFARWAFRHRSAFLPFAVTGTAFGLAAFVHPHHERWWITTACVTALATMMLGIPHRLLWERPAGRFTHGLLARLWAACGIDRPAERAYATVIIASVGGWLAAAMALGPFFRPLPQIAGIATVILGIPWWVHRRRRARVRIERIIQAWPSMAEDIGLPGSKIASATGDAWGWTARVILRKGGTAEAAVPKIPAIESGLGVRPGSVRVIPDTAREGRFTLRVIEKDPHAAPIPWPGVTNMSITRPAELGVSESGQPVQVLFLRRHVLIGGTTGAGKSGIVNVIMAYLVACRDVVIWAVDLKGGMELRPWASCIERTAFTPEQATELLRDAVTEINRRAARMATEGKRSWEPAPDDPALVIVIDEYAEMPGPAHAYADSAARLGRAVAVMLMAATQRPSQDAMGKGAVRSQMDIRICLRVRERRDVDLILGQGAFKAGWKAHQLNQPGAFLISDPEHAAPERHRAYLIDDGQIARHAARYAHGRPGRPERPQTAPGSPQTDGDGAARGDDYEWPETALWAALRAAGPDGASVADLERACGMRRRWVYYRLREHAAAGRAVQVKRGYWRAVPPAGGTSGDGRPPPRPAPGRPPGRPGKRRRRGRNGK
jgi:DNA segregation ATPase FtsK/SpoIIIE, S-DNA-T family